MPATAYCFLTIILGCIDIYNVFLSPHLWNILSMYVIYHNCKQFKHCHCILLSNHYPFCIDIYNVFSSPYLWNILSMYVIYHNCKQFKHQIKLRFQFDFAPRSNGATSVGLSFLSNQFIFKTQLVATALWRLYISHYTHHYLVTMYNVLVYWDHGLCFALVWK